jgi:hypothetical protein
MSDCTDNTIDKAGPSFAEFTNLLQGDFAWVWEMAMPGIGSLKIE